MFVEKKNILSAFEEKLKRTLRDKIDKFLEIMTIEMENYLQQTYNQRDAMEKQQKLIFKLS